MADASDDVRTRWIDELRAKLRFINGNLVAKLGDRWGFTSLVVRDSDDREEASINSYGVGRGRAWHWENGWLAPSYRNGWADFGGAFTGMRMWRDGSGMVMFQGVVGGGTLNTPIAVAPPAYRPQTVARFVGISNGGATQYEIVNDGTLVQYGGANTWASLTGGFCRAHDNVDAWNYPQAFTNSWVNWSSGAQPARFWKDTGGIVHLEGMISSGTLTATAFTLPPGYRPSEQLVVPVGSNGGLGRVDVTTAGAVAPNAGSTVWFSLSGIHFRAADGYEPWTAPTLLNSWLNFGAPYCNAGYWKDGFGRVHLKGLVKSGTIPADVFVLPAGYRPGTQLVFSCVSMNASNRVDVLANGSVNIQSGNNGWASLDGIIFRAEQ
jgi:hypothetical protein